MSDKVSSSTSESAVHKNVLEKLRTALRTDGDFPTRAKIVSELRSLANNPLANVEQVSEVILREPSLATRVLHMVNSAFYMREVPIMTITQAVIQLGMQALSELCAGLILMQRFVPAASRGGIFADNVKKSVLTALLTSFLAEEGKEEAAAERGYLAGTFFNLGYLLLAYYFPQVYETAARRAQSKGGNVSQSVTEILGVNPAELSLTIVDALGIPDFYRDTLVEAHKPRAKRARNTSVGKLANALATADEIASAIMSKESREELEDVLYALEGVSGFELDQLFWAVEDLAEAFPEHCNMLEMSFLSLPDYVLHFADVDESTEVDEKVEEIPACEETPGQAQTQANIMRYINELRTAIQNKETLSSIITAVMETLAFALGFDRVLLLLPDNSRTELIGKMGLGDKFDKDPKSIRRRLNSNAVDAKPDSAAFLLGTLQLAGDPIFEDGWPFAALPVGGLTTKATGVLYADRLSSLEEDVKPLDGSLQASLSLLTTLLDQAVANQS